MSKFLILFFILGLVGCNEATTLKPLPPVEKVLDAPKNLIYAVFPFERDYGTGGTDMRSCPNRALNSQDMVIFPQSFQYTKGNPIIELHPCYHGGEATTFSINPALPDGLHFSTKSGRIAGTPTQLRLTQNTFVITASNSEGSTSSTISIQVLDRPPVFSYATNNIELISNNRPFSFAPISSGGDIDSYTITPSPTDFTFNSSTGRISGITDAPRHLTDYEITGVNSGGVNTSTYNLSFRVAPAMENLSSGKDYSCFTLNNTLRCWGGNGEGQLGTGNLSNRIVPTPVQNSPSFLHYGKLSLGNDYACSVYQPTSTNPELTCWGLNTSLNFGAKEISGVLQPPIANNNYLMPESSYSGDVYDVATSKGTTDKSTAILYSSGGVSGYVKDFGSYSVGNYSSTDYNVQSGGVNISGINTLSKGDGFTCGIDGAGTIFCWGVDTMGQLGGTPSSSLEPVQNLAFNPTGFQATEISSGKNFSCARASSGLYCWGDNTYGQLGENPATTASRQQATMNIPLASLRKFVSGYDHSCAILVDGTVSCWGRNNFGQLGNQSQTDSYVPVVVKYDNEGTIQDLTDVIEISAGDGFTCAKTNNFDIYCWGNNSSGQLGNNSMAFSTIAVKVPNLF